MMTNARLRDGSATSFGRACSDDGSTIGWESSGSGASVLFVHGGLGDRRTWSRVAEFISTTHQCHRVDRRGRGLSTEEKAPYSFEREYEDLAVVMETLDAPVHVVAHSSGAICALGAALRSDRVASLTLYEPPLPIARFLSTDAIGRVERALASGERFEAVAIGLLEIIGLPEVQAAAVARGDTLQHLAPTWPRECREINALAPDCGLYASLRLPTLLLTGEASGGYLRAAVGALSASLPEAHVVELPGLDHIGPVTDPVVVAAEIARFLSTIEEPG